MNELLLLGCQHCKPNPNVWSDHIEIQRTGIAFDYIQFKILPPEKIEIDDNSLQAATTTILESASSVCKGHDTE